LSRRPAVDGQRRRAAAIDRPSRDDSRVRIRTAGRSRGWPFACSTAPPGPRIAAERTRDLGTALNDIGPRSTTIDTIARTSDPQRGATGFEPLEIELIAQVAWTP
jgi:hypothetical protein